MKCKVFKIHPQNESDELKLNQFLKGIELKQVFASVVSEDGYFWSVLVFYEDEKQAAARIEKSSSFISQLIDNPLFSQIDKPEKIEKPAPEPIVLTAEQENDFNALKKWRNDRAAQDGLAPYMIAHNESLVQIAALPVKSPADLLQIKGFGEKRAQKYGDEILRVLAREVSDE
jgi:superfamily II DNA helicase RecQ